MPTVKRPEVLAIFYQATSSLISRGAVPSTLIHSSHTIFRSVPGQYLPKPPAGGHVSKHTANQALMPRDGSQDAGNRFSGPSLNAGIPSAGGLYCVMQQQALVNEVMHYAKKPSHAAFADKCVLKIRLMASLNCVDLSPHNPGHGEFLKQLLNSRGAKESLSKGLPPGTSINLWDEITDGDDCSVARGIGLAVAQSSMYHGLVAETVRRSERSLEEKGDNLILYGEAMKQIAKLYVEQAYFFDDATHSVEIFPVQFP